MKKITDCLLVVVMLFALIGCSKDDEPKDKSELINMWISAQTTVIDIPGEDGHENPIECMQVKYSPDGSWEPMLFGTIEYFQYEKGVEYELSVVRNAISNPPADGSAYTYRLERIISHRVVNANMNGIDSCFEIPAEGKNFDIDFTTNAPCEIVRISGNLFGDVDLLELYDTGYSKGYSLRLKIQQNPGMGRVKLLTLRFSNG